MAIKKLQKAWRRLRKIFSKKTTNSVNVGTDLSIPEHYQYENEFSFVVQNRLAETLAETDDLRKEKQDVATLLDNSKQTLNRTQKEIDDLKSEISKLKQIIESTIEIADLDIFTTPVKTNDADLDVKSSTTDAAAPCV